MVYELRVVRDGLARRAGLEVDGWAASPPVRGPRTRPDSEKRSSPRPMHSRPSHRRFLPSLLTILLAGIGLTAGLLATPATLAAAPAARWTPERAHAWQERTGWLVGCNYSPAYAINQLEMWQADTCDPAAIDRELAWAESTCSNSPRVFLH